ncbi:hypothetical protein [Nocardia takedensis]|uniref:hypothetical protein n=1 Tax=Nocardia takedensis TaxID=259390 RepID=UPI000315D4BB|nr:hypothetical protein [Nocardia takedensis]
MSESAEIVRRTAALPDSARLIDVIEGLRAPTEPLDYLAAAFARLWRTRLTEHHRTVLDDTAATRSLIVASDEVADLTVAFDREVTWQLDNRPVQQIDDGPGGVTLGEVVNLLALYCVAHQRWPGPGTMAMLGVEAGRYTMLVRAIVDLGGRQSWRRCHGEPDPDLATRIEAVASFLRPGESTRIRMPTKPDGTAGLALSITRAHRPPPITEDAAEPVLADQRSAPCGVESVEVGHIDVARLLGRYLVLTGDDQVRVLLWMSTVDRLVRAEHLATAIGVTVSVATRLLERLHESGHLIVEYRWRATGKTPRARATAAQRLMLTEITTHGTRFAAIDLDTRRLRTARSLLGSGYVQRRTLYALAPVTAEKLHGLTDP